MSTKTTNKWIRDNFDYIIQVPYGELYYLLIDTQRDWYHSGIYGWNYDAYMVGLEIVIITGDRPIGNIKPSYELLEEYNNIAREIYKSNLEWTIKKYKIKQLRQEFVEVCITNN